MKVATNATKNCDILYLAKRELWLPQIISHIITRKGARIGRLLCCKMFLHKCKKSCVSHLFCGILLQRRREMNYVECS